MEAFDELIGVVDTLRGENGCPWDKKQTFESLERYILEEAREVVDAVAVFRTSGSAENLCEELGDVLFEILLYSRIASEEGLFTIEDVIRRISDKMIGRHPRVFKEPGELSKEELGLSWEELKKREKERRKPLETGGNKGIS